MTMFFPPRARAVLLSGLFALLASGCASIQQAVDSVRGAPAPADAPAPAPAKVEAPAPESPPARPVTRSKPRSVETPAPAPAPEPKPAAKPPEAPKAAPIPGPAWLQKCQSVQFAGGVVRCDTNLLLAKPSPTVQVFTRDPARVVAGQITLRKGLPYVYRLYVVP